MITHQDNTIAVARRFLFVREVGGPNRGLWVQLFQRYTHTSPGESWCASFVSYVLGVVYVGESPLQRTASCADMLAEARYKGMEVKAPEPGDVFFYVNEQGHAHHVGIVTAVDRSTEDVIGIAGNTSSDGKSSNGDGVYEHAINTARTVYIRLP